MSAIPGFSDAVAHFVAFLRAQGLPTNICWAFREDLYSTSPIRHHVAWPLPERNVALAHKLVQIAQQKGVLELKGLFRVGEHVVTTVIAARPDDVQGWSPGMRASIHMPFVEAMPIRNRLAWRLHRLRPGYRRYQRYADDVPTRRSCTFSESETI